LSWFDALVFLWQRNWAAVPEFQRRLEWLNSPPLQLKVLSFYTSRDCKKRLHMRMEGAVTYIGKLETFA